MTPYQLNGTRLLSDLLVRMVKDAYSESPALAEQAREWLSLDSFEGMASVHRVCVQLSAAQSLLADSANSHERGYLRPEEWLHMSLRACSEPSQLSALESEIECLIATGHERCMSILGSPLQDTVRVQSITDDDFPSSNDPSPSL